VKVKYIHEHSFATSSRGLDEEKRFRFLFYYESIMLEELTETLVSTFPTTEIFYVFYVQFAVKNCIWLSS
jgi:hypothetical protein